MTTPWTGRPVVYRLFNARGGCIYVGCTRSFETRIASHRLNAFFGDEISRSRVTIHATRDEALEVEKAEITRLRPRYNIYGRGMRINWGPCDFVEVLDALERRIASGEANRSGTGPSPCDIDRISAHFARRFPAIAAVVLDDLAVSA